MEKIEFRGMWVRGDFYNASEVDALLMKIANVIGSPKDAGRLPEALKYVLSSYRYRCEKTEAKHDALLADVRRLVEAARMVIKISDRNHDAWNGAKQAIANVERHLMEENGGKNNI